MEEQGECPICYERFEQDFLSCETCAHNICIRCVVNLRSHACPFCRTAFDKVDFFAYSSSASSSASSSSSHDEFVGPNSDWNASRILRHQIKRMHKRQEHEAQRARNVQLSRTHNHNTTINRTVQAKRNNKYPKRTMQFEMDEEG